jgi:beta-1,4-mannosyltransferase
VNVLAWPASSEVSGNEYNSLLTRAVATASGTTTVEFSPLRLLRGNWDVWHLHWPDHLFRTRRLIPLLAKLAVLAVLVEWARLRQTRIVWTVHNTQPHAAGRPRLHRRYLRWLARRVDAAIALSDVGAAQARAAFPALAGRPLSVIPLGHYLDAFPNRVTRREARATIGLDEHVRVIAFVGRISPYKGVPELVRAFRAVEDHDIRLLVAGEPLAAGIRAELEAAAAADPRVVLHLRHVADDELQVFFNASDLVALPYREILHSASALLALSFGRPVLAPARGALTELEREFGADWIRLYVGPLGPDVLRRTLSVSAPDPQALLGELRVRLDWARIGRATSDVYESVQRG